MVLLDPEPLGCKVTDQVGSVYLRSLFFFIKSTRILLVRGREFSVCLDLNIEKTMQYHINSNFKISRVVVHFGCSECFLE